MFMFGHFLMCPILKSVLTQQTTGILGLETVNIVLTLICGPKQEIFFHPYNVKLAELFDDMHYLWNE